MEKFEKLAFKPREVVKIAFKSRIYKQAAFFSVDDLYPAEDIERALKEVFGTDKSILNLSSPTYRRPTLVHHWPPFWTDHTAYLHITMA